MSLFTSAQPLNRSMKLILSNKRLTRRSISSSSTSQSSSASSSSATGSDTTSSSSTGGSSGQSDHANPSTGKRWSFFVSTAFHGKPTEQDEPGMKRRAKPARLLQGFAPDSAIARWRDSSLENAPWGAGHDWFFVQPIPSSSAGSSGTTREGLVLGIADGVGGWEDSGVDPAHFSQALMYYCKEAVKKNGKIDPSEVMQMGYDGVQTEGGVVAGSSTACVVTLDSSSGIMDAANLGDSTFILVRNSLVIHAQPSQTHYFNAPRQLSKIPKSSRSDGNFLDKPKDADRVQLQLQTDDILLLATDGFSDNVWNRELEQIITLILKEDAALPSLQLAEKVAASCCHYARVCSFKQNKESPFEVEARQHNLNFRGGKVDDVCVIAVVVKGAVRESKL